MEVSVNFRRAIFAISLTVVPVLPAAAASGCKPPQALHSMAMTLLPDGRFAAPVVFGETPGTLILDSADVAELPKDLGRNKKAPSIQGGLGDLNINPPNLAGIAGTLTEKTVQKLGLTPNVMASQVLGAGGHSSKYKATVDQFAFQGLTPFRTQFLVSPDRSGAKHSGSFSINNYKQFNFDVDLDFPGRTVRFMSRDHCRGDAVDWSAPTVESLKFTIDGNGYIRFPVTVDGKKLSAVLDTGSPITTLDFGVAGRRLRVKENDPTLTIVNKTTDGRAIYSRPFQSIAFGDVNVPNPTIVLVPGIASRGEAPRTGSRISRSNKGSSPPLIIGMSVLRQLRVHIAFDEKRLYFAQSEAESP
jgi:hypothetical protein